MSIAYERPSLCGRILDGIGKSQGVAIIDDAGSVTRDQFLERVAGRQSELGRLSLPPGSAVLLASRRGSPYWSDLTALWGLGLVPVPVDPTASEPHLAFIIEKTEPAARIGLHRGSGQPGSTVPLLEGIPISDRKSVLALPNLAEQRGAVLFTSGSTGLPKGVLLRQRAILGNATGACDVLRISPEDRLAVAVPYHFTSPICHFIAAAISGATLVCSERPMMPGDLARFLVQTRTTGFGGAPVQLRWIAQSNATSPLPELRWMMSSGDYLTVETIDLIRQSLRGVNVFTFYGLTELGGRFCALPADLLDRHKGSVGRPIKGLSVSIVDEHRQVVPDGTIGEIAASGELVFDGYLGDPQATAAARLADGRFLTGDQGYIDAAGMLHVVGRTDDVFKSAGQKICATVIQDALLGTSRFEDVAVMAAEDPMVGHVPVAYYVSRSGQDVPRGEIIGHLRQALPVNHLPHRLVRLPSIPRTPTGKLKREALKAIIASITSEGAQISR